MTTDAERREATDLWTIQLREQQLNAAVQLAQQDERNVELKAQLAERTLVIEQLQMALSVRDTQLAAVTAERDDYRAKFRELEHELQLERGQVVAQQQRAEAAERERDRAMVRLGEEVLESTQIHQRLDAVAVDAMTARIRVGELEAQLRGLLPLAQTTVSKIEFFQPNNQEE